MNMRVEHMTPRQGIDMRVPDSQMLLNKTGSVLAFGLICILGFVTWALIFKELPQANENALLILIGVLSSNVGTIINFFFGTSASNKSQQDTIGTLAATAQAAQTTLSAVGTTGGIDAMNLKPGDTAVATATPTGTTIKKDEADGTQNT